MSAKPHSATSSSTVSRSRWPRIARLVEPQENKTHLAAFARAVQSGLSCQPRSLPWAFFYDDEGSRLFEAICELPEYYLTRTEDGILRRHADEMVAGLAAGGDTGLEPTIIELGSGSAVKTQRLLAAGLRQHDRLHYVPIDVSPSALEDSAQRLTRHFPELKVTGYVADYRRGLERIMARAKGPRLIVFLGSSLGNYEMDAAVELLTMIGQTMRPDDRLLLGTDMAKERSLLESAYDDPRGVTAAFNLNLLRRINRELGADFAIEAFEHRAVYHPDRGRVEMHLLSTRDQIVHLAAAGMTVRLAAGEMIHTENSHKYTPETLSYLQSRAGFVEEAAWTDERGWFRLQHWRLKDVEPI
ncbi:MAG: L-histidine N(alpha)-methyltransferase [Isosphaeraceae bacterium]